MYMRKIITATFITMDGVMQAPGGPEEDPSENFAYGGWQAYLGDSITEKAISKYFIEPFELLLGRVTYDIFASYWPNHTEIESVAKPFNSTKKYVVSNKKIDLTWNNSYLITGDVVEEIKKLKEKDGPDLFVWGSGNLIQTLLKHKLIDTMNILTYPVTIGSGKKLFSDGTRPQAFKVIDSVISPTGVVIATYEPAGEFKTGTIGK
jgi:dihydrofolate reductase